MIKILIPKNFDKERKYIIEVFFEEFLGIKFSIEEKEIKQYEIILENDKKLIINDAFFGKINSKKYLDTRNSPKEIAFTENKFTREKDIPVIFGGNKISVNKNEIHCAVDIFASAFFMLTRWEEYVIKEKDKHGRFPEQLSYAIKHKIDHRPIVNEYVEMLKNMLVSLDAKIKFKQHKYEAVITHDIDFLYKYKKFKKFVGTFLKSFIPSKRIKTPLKVLSDYIKIKRGKMPDPYLSFNYLMDISERYNLISHFYFIPGMRGETDIYYNINEKTVKKYIKNIVNRGHIVGVHGTYEGYNNNERFNNELKRLKKVYPIITEGRQHFLRFQNPTTWQIWEDNGLKTDSTIGFTKKNGFRAGVCYEYSVFNIETRKKLKLKERPLVFMDSSFDDIPSTKTAIDEILKLKETVKKYQGNFVILWHNNSFYYNTRKKLSLKYKEIIEQIAK